eukprot:CAMPEP_0198428464 /NCGR_PEP_ID=MMETSP1452-20131203/6564_1 /TAXON_ID=1181717 /ORGANISM="Synchroma pusillum, Strain CCMP3072" /LENGTH=156 /DNA_ID=CAMNT_0044148859 /DNA_START=8 /DNA_END=476 /DNA_ORIENTATION=+
MEPVAPAQDTEDAAAKPEEAEATGEAGGLEEEFAAVAARVREWTPPRPVANEDKLRGYALFKQATEGDCNIARPGIFDQAGRYKWDAWSGLRGMPQDEAKRGYIDEITRQMEAMPERCPGLAGRRPPAPPAPPARGAREPRDAYSPAAAAAAAAAA